MRKLILFLLLLGLWAPSAFGATATIRGMTEDTNPSGTDIMYVVKDPGGTPLDRKVTISNMLKLIPWASPGAAIGTGTPVAGTFTTITGGAGGFQVDADGDVVAKSLTITRGATGDSMTLFEGTGGGDNFRTVSVPNALTADVDLQHANALPAANQFQLYPAPTTGVSQYTWTTYQAYLGTTLVDFTRGSGGLTLAGITLTAPVVGAATATSLLASGIVDGTAPVTITATSAGTTIGGTYKSGYISTNPTSASATSILTLPTAAAGLQYCINNGAAKTGILRILTATGATQYIDLDGVITANTGGIQATAAAGNFVCLYGVDSTTWKSLPTKGTWSRITR